ncbi:hypothetical protein [Methylibium sp.]|uniref:hypothetical protein n=1 Tax=Methylibium sp. TaxID=2067992 RepID=UPI00345B58CE
MMVRVGFGAVMTAAVAVLACGAGTGALAQDAVVYKCPGNLYTGTITPKEASDRGCKALEGGSVTVIQSPPVRRAPAPKVDSGASRPADSRVDPADQRARDTDKRRILENELRREGERLAGLKLEYNNGQPERRGDEKNYQKYLDRTAELKSGIERSESDVAALRRELDKLGGASAGSNPGSTGGGV